MPQSGLRAGDEVVLSLAERAGAFGAVVGDSTVA
jgi:hypothetical protein